MEAQSYDIVIVGAGPFACFSAFYLCQQNFNIALVYPEHTNILETFQNSLRVCWPSLNDPATRAEVAHGHEVAGYLQQFCGNGVNLFAQTIIRTLAEEENWVPAPCYRLGLQDFEQQELAEALKLGFALTATADPAVYKENFQSLICLDPDKFRNSMINYLKSNKVKFIQARVEELTETQKNCKLKLSNQQQIEAEITILGNSLNISKLLTNYKEILIPMSDCLMQYKIKASSTKPFLPLTFRASNGHICGSITQKEDEIFLKLSGPRFLLPGAGAGIFLTTEEISSHVWINILKYHQNIILPFLTKHLNLSYFEKIEDLNAFLTHKLLLVDCYPCDELPILGEFGKLGKILGNTGWLATGFSAGVWGSFIIQELVTQEKSLFLHSRLHPRRLYTKFIKN